ncbi:hypothetical protein SKAU_G00147640 [Synaphobranchus kaupii]|uniref:Uncharacterized protein n=1 Tax=Synaphobranchus kaupii TaxID=118154 RepID=A0A9Q1FUK6_SYNKA|nr:hypothetical protein SKAU_G00147640 [Synaphobranchus kaupii]
MPNAGVKQLFLAFSGFLLITISILANSDHSTACQRDNQPEKATSTKMNGGHRSHNFKTESFELSAMVTWCVKQVYQHPLEDYISHHANCKQQWCPSWKKITVRKRGRCQRCSIHSAYRHATFKLTRLLNYFSIGS